MNVPDALTSCWSLSCRHLQRVFCVPEFKREDMEVAQSYAKKFVLLMLYNL